MADNLTGTQGHEEEVVNVGGLKATMQKLKTNILDGKVENTTSVNGHALSGDVTVSKSDVGLGNVTNDAQVTRAEMGAASGVATLDTAGKVPSSQLPSYVDDVLEFNSKGDFPSSGEAGKIYVDKTANKTWRWGGTDYVEISQSLALGETSSTAYSGDKGKALADKLSGIENGAQVHRAPTAAEVKSALGTGSGTSKYLREDGSWQTPPDNNTTYSAGSGLSLSGTTFSLSLTKGLVTTALGYTPPTSDTNTWRPLGTGANDACAGNDPRLSNAREPYFANNTWYNVGDDAAIGDHNVGGTLCVKALNGTPNIKLYDSSDNAYADVWNTKSLTNLNQLTNGPGYITGINKTMVTNALGYTPPTSDTNTHWTTRIYAGASGTAANAATASPYIKITDDNTYSNQIRLVGGGATTVSSDANGNITISSTDTNTWPSKVSQLTNDNGFLTAASFTNNNKGTSVGKIMVADSSNGLGYTSPSNMSDVLYCAGNGYGLAKFEMVTHEEKNFWLITAGGTSSYFRGLAIGINNTSLYIVKSDGSWTAVY